MALQACAPVFELQEWEDEGYVDLPEYSPRDPGASDASQEANIMAINSQQLQNSLDGRGSDDFLGRRTLSYTPPPADFEKWRHELYDDLPDRPSAEEYDTSLSAQYNFRPAPREAGRTVAIRTWVDQDESGTYDPSGKRLPIDLPLKRRRELREALPDGTPKKPKITTYQSGRFNGFQLPLKLTFTSKFAKIKLKSFGNALNNWPEPTNSPQTTGESSHERIGCGSHSSACAELPDFTSRELRMPLRRETSELQYFDGDEPCALTDITLGFPAARGCKGCNALGDSKNECPLLQEGARYPCATCREDDIKCELIIQPIKKRACEACGRRRVVCSYRQDGSDHTLPCKDCANAGIKCVAGPASGRTRTGPSLDQDNHVEKSSCERTWRRSLKGCAGCSMAKKWCSIKNKHGKTPCNRCVENKIDCTPVPARRTIRDKIKWSKAAKGTVPKKELEEMTREPNVGKFRTITTSLAHPINFNYLSEDPNEPMPCHWCDDTVYGLLGLGEVEVEVVDNGDGQGYTEVLDGHVAAGYPLSRMCGFCTLDRLKITACKTHEIEPIEGIDPETFDPNSALEYMTPDAASSAPFDWCSICPAAALFACCKPMEDMGYQADEIAKGEETGCGLKLCEPCAVALVNDHGGALPQLLGKLMLEKSKLTKENRGFVLRADADFLHPDGELLRRMAAG